VGKETLTSKIICFASAKGGTGKTVLSASFAKFLGALNKKVLLIDTDAATNGLTLFYLRRLTEAKKINTDKETPLTGIFESHGDFLPTPIMLDKNIDFIPATFILTQTDTAEPRKLESALQQVIKSLGEKYEYIFLDAEAGSDVYAEISIGIADQVVIVSEYDPVSIAGVDRMKNIFANVMPYDKRWILYNKVLPEFARELGKTRIAEKYLPPVPWDEEVVRAFAERKLALDTENGNEHTLAIVRTIGALLGEEIKNEIDDWRKQKSEAIRKPIQALKAETEIEIAALESAVIENEYELRDLKQRLTRRLVAELAILVIAASYIAIFGEILGFIQPLFYIVIFTYAIIFAVFIVSVEQRRSKRTKAKEIEKTAQLRILKAKLSDLEDVYKKQKVLLESGEDSMLFATIREKRSQNS
jgi:cellulose biosynthesis protein BcsQ